MAQKNTAVAEAPEMTCKIEDAGPCRKKLAIHVPATLVAETLELKFDSVESQAAIPGFRAGRVPRKIIERRFGEAVRDETKQELVSQAYRKAVEDNKLNVIGEPEGGEELKDATVDGSKDISFTIELEIAPEFDLPSFDGISIKKPMLEVNDEMVDAEIEKLTVNEGELDPVEGAAKPGDYCVGTGVMRLADAKKDDEPIHDIKGAVVQIPTTEARDGFKKGEGMILGVRVTDFSKQAGKPKKGDTLTVKTKGPDQHENEDVRGKDIVIDFEVEEIHRIVPAEIDDLLKRSGFSDEKQLRENLTLRLNQRVLVEQQAAMRQQVADHLIDSISFELPKKLSSNQAERTLQRRRMELMHKGVDATEIEEHLAEMREASAEAAQRELKLFFILDHVAKQEKIQVSQQEVGGRIVQMAMSRGQKPDELRQHLTQTGQIQGIAQQIAEHKSLDAIVAKAKTEEISADDFNEMMKKKNAG